MPIMLAHRLSRRLAEVRKNGTLKYLGPDGKSQVTVEYKGGRPHRVHTIVLAAQHTTEILDASGHNITDEARREIVDNVVRPVIAPEFLDDRTIYHVNPTGKFVVGGPQSDTGMTGRKIIVDTYGGMAPHGGGAFSERTQRKSTGPPVTWRGISPRTSWPRTWPTGARCSLPTRSAWRNRCRSWCFVMEQRKLPNGQLVKLVRKHFELTPKGFLTR